MRIIKTKKRYAWLIVALLSIMLAAPNGTIIKQAFTETEPAIYNVLRFGIISAIALPYVIANRKKISKRGLRHSLKFGVFLSIAVLSYLSAVDISQASYVALITMLTPLVFVVYAIKLDKQRVSRRSVMGLLIAAVGGLLVVALPLMLHRPAALVFYPLATLLAFVNVFTFPLATLNSKKAHDAKVTMFMSFGISSMVVFIVSLAFAAVTVDHSDAAVISRSTWLAVLYSGLVVALIARILNVLSYERLGAATNSLFAYIETLMAVVIPMLVLGERLSWELLFGVILILIGVFIVENHRITQHKHAHITRHD